MITKIAKSYANNLYKKFYYENYPGDKKLLNEYFNSDKFNNEVPNFIGIDHPSITLSNPLHPVNPELPSLKLKLIGGIGKYMSGGGFSTSELLNKEREELGKTTLPKGIYLSNPKRFYNRISSPLHPVFGRPKALLHNLVALHELYEGKGSDRQMDPKEEYDYSDRAIMGRKHPLGERLRNEWGDKTKITRTGMHINLDVLGNEANDVLSVIENADPDDLRTVQKMIEMRKKTKEIDILRGITKRRYGTDRFTNEDLLKLRTLLARDKRGTFIHKLDNVYRDKEDNPIITPSLKIIE